MTAKNLDLVAHRSLLLVGKSTGRHKPVIVKLGRPYWVEEGIEAACPVMIEGMLGELSDIRGVDLFDALELAIKFVNSYLAGRGPELLWPDGETYQDDEASEPGRLE